MTRHGASAPGTKRALLALAGALLALAAMPALAAAHHREIRVSGTYVPYDFGTTQCAPKGASPDILACSTTGFRSTYAGSLVGDVATAFSNIIDCKTGRTWGRGVETFAGSLNGSATGTLTWKIAFRSDFDCATSLPSGFQGRSPHQGQLGRTGRNSRQAPLRRRDLRR